MNLVVGDIYVWNSSLPWESPSEITVWHITEPYVKLKLIVQRESKDGVPSNCEYYDWFKISALEKADLTFVGHDKRFVDLSKKDEKPEA